MIVGHVEGVTGIRRYHDAVFGPVVEAVSAVGRGRDSAALSFLIGAATGDSATFHWAGYHGNGEGGQQRLGEIGDEVTVSVHGKGIAGSSGDHSAVLGPAFEGVVVAGRCGDGA